ncbi:MAG: class I SAM-dependent methyltransferase family protein [Candidatus Nanoarchaeia archaeon]
MKCIKVKKQEAESVRKKLLDEGNLNKDYAINRDKDFVYLPVLKKVIGYKIVEKTLPSLKKETSLKEALKKELSKKELEQLKTSMDVVGTIAILEIDKELRKHEKKIAQTLLKINKQIKTVVRKEGEHTGLYRIQDYTYLAGEKTFETIHKENGAQFYLDITRTYFSVRLSTDRLRIAQQIKNNELVLVMFSGIGVYPIVFSKHSKAKEIYGIELNPDAHEYGEKNLQLNKTNNVFLFCGDVREVATHLGRQFDRILMPLPHGAEQFLPLLSQISKKGATIHYYTIAQEDEFDNQKELIKKYYPKAKIIDIIKCGQPSPRTYRICIEFILN